MKIKLNKKGLVKIFLLFLFIFLPKKILAENASMFFYPSSGSYKIGQTFSVNILASTKDTPLNAVSGVVNFDNNKLQITNISKNGSIINFWVSEPTFSNGSGSMNFEGVVLNPGFTGNSGKIISITFKVLSGNSTNIKFSSGLILANDGLGTNITGGLGSGNFTIIKEEVQISEEPENIKTDIESLNLISLYSSTHPDQNKWYSNNNVKINWELPEGTISSSTLVDKNPKSSPNIISTPALSFEEYKNLENGVWYFHIRLKNKNGWGNTTHFRVQIDLKKPDSINILETKRDDKTDPNVRFVFNAKDSGSGIDHYEINIEDKIYTIWQNDGTNQVFVNPIMKNGQHSLYIKAFDKAGNFLDKTVGFNIEPLNFPEIINYKKELNTNEIISISGKTYPNSDINFWIQYNNKKEENRKLKSDDNGNFAFVDDNESYDGTYRFWLRVTKSNGAQSEYTKNFFIKVKSATLFDISSLTMILILVVVLFLLIMLCMIYKMSLLEKKIYKIKTYYKNSFKALEYDIEDVLMLLDKAQNNRKITKDDMLKIEKLKKVYNTLNKAIKK